MNKIKRVCTATFMLILLFVFAFGCDSIPDGVVESSSADESIVEINAPSMVEWTSEDSTFITTVTLRDNSEIDSINVIVINSKGENEIGKTFRLTDDGNFSNGDYVPNNGVYSSKLYMLSSMTSGNYTLEYHKTSNGTDKKIAYITFKYENHNQNYPPVISNLVMPSSIARGVQFTMKLTVTDPNGLANLSAVVFKLIRPDGTISMNGGLDYFMMYDNGDTSGSGDTVRGDGIFSLKNSFGLTTQTGAWTFEFRAIDKAGAVSNIITKNMVVE